MQVRRLQVGGDKLQVRSLQVGGCKLEVERLQVGGYKLEGKEDAGWEAAVARSVCMQTKAGSHTPKTPRCPPPRPTHTSRVSASHNSCRIHIFTMCSLVARWLNWHTPKHPPTPTPPPPQPPPAAPPRKTATPNAAQPQREFAHRKAVAVVSSCSTPRSVQTTPPHTHTCSVAASQYSCRIHVSTMRLPAAPGAFAFLSRGSSAAIMEVISTMGSTDIWWPWGWPAR